MERLGQLKTLIEHFADESGACHNPGKPGAARVERSLLIQLLHRVQDTFGCLPHWALPELAAACNTTRADVHAVASFYPDFRLADTPPARPVARICRAEACQAIDGRQLYDQAREQLADMAEIESAYCLGNCALAPAAQVGERTLARAGIDSITKALDEQKQPEKLKQKDPLITPPDKRTKTAALTIRLGLDTGAISAGATELLDPLTQLAASRQADLITTGGRGLYHLEPLVEIAAEGRRHAYAQVTPEDVDSLLLNEARPNTEHPRYIGLVDKQPQLAAQKRITFANAGEIHPLDFDSWKAAGGMRGLRRALSMDGEAIVEELIASGLRGRGGAGFPTGIKWRTVMQAQADQKYVVCNADEGDSGTFADRLLLESDPFTLIEGMVIAAHTVGANQGYVYLRSEYPLVEKRFDLALRIARRSGLLGENIDINGKGLNFDIELRRGAGAYICGEETSLLESLEGKRGTIRFKPPLPALQGAFGKPTVLNNVITLATVPAILAQGAQAYAGLGRNQSRGTLTAQLGGNVKRGGLYEIPFGLTLRELVEDLGGGTASGRPVRAVQVGGPLGAYLPPSLFDTPLDYESFAAKRAMLGHGGVVVFDDSVDLAEQAEYALRFCAHESCGKCTPCRIGSTRGAELVTQMRARRARQGSASEGQVKLLTELCEVMEQTSLCALGGLTPYPVLSALDHFREDFGLTQGEGE